MSRIGDAVRLSVGTFSAVPVPAPRRVDRTTAGIAVCLAPLAVLPVGAAVAFGAWAAVRLGLPGLAAGTIAISVGALGNRAFHLDGLADTADALASSYDRERALTVARLGDVGPAGASTLVLVLLLQVTGAATLATQSAWGPAAVGTMWCLARMGATVGLSRGTPTARSEGMGATFGGSVPPAAIVTVWLMGAAVAGGVAAGLGLPVAQGPVVVGAALIATLALIIHVTRRLGGIIGDALGASIELSAAVLLLGLAAVIR